MHTTNFQGPYTTMLAQIQLLIVFANWFDPKGKKLKKLRFLGEIF